MIEEIATTLYITSDESVFENKDDAIAYEEIKLEVFRIFVDSKTVDSLIPNHYDLVEILVKHKEKVLELLKNL